MEKKIIFTDHSDELLVSYLKDISKYKVLESDEIAKLITLVKTGDEKAREQLINANLRFVVTIAKQFQGRGVSLMDLISSGNIGLIKAINLFDSTRGVPFVSYAVWWIKQEIFHTIYWQGKEIRLPISQQMLVIKILETTSNFIKEQGRNPSPEEISELTDIPLEQINFLSQYSNKLVSVDDYIGGDEDNSQVCDVIPDDSPDIDKELDKDYLNNELQKIISKLPVREHDVICMLFGIGMPAVNQQIVSEMFGVGGERIRQIKEKALDRLHRVYGKKLQALL